MYEFIQPSQLNSLVSGQSYKVGDHKAYHTSVANLTGLSRANLREWSQVGIMANNVNASISPLTGEQSIEVLKTGSSQSDSAALSDGGATALIIIAILSVAADAYSAYQKIRDQAQINEKTLNEAILAMGNPEVGPAEIDWLSGLPQNINNSDVGEDSNAGLIAVLIALALGAGLLYNNNKKK